MTYRNAVRGDRAAAIGDVHKKFGEVLPCGSEVCGQTDTDQQTLSSQCFDPLLGVK